MARFPTLRAATEAEILAGAQGHAQARDAAFSTLFRELREPVFALCLHLTGRRADAEDAVQDVFLSVHRALPGFRGEARLSTWVYRVALRAALHVRSRQRPGEPVGDDLSVDRAEAELLSRDEARRTLAALQQLSAHHRAVLSLFALDGLSHREVAEVLGVPEGTIWSRLHAARKRLAEVLGRGPP
jgi:RNA polymerase sigma-70 factor (ECF subfamily)